MSGIRVNEWLHNSGTGGIWQTSAGNVGIASSVPTAKLVVTGDANISGIATAETFIPTVGQLSHRNLIINGAFQVAQRGTSSTSSGYYTVDRFRSSFSGTDESPTYSQHALTSSDTGPWEVGLRNSFHVQNGNQTSGWGAADYINILMMLEGHDVATSGWNYTSTTSYVTLSYWVKSSVSQAFYHGCSTNDGTGYWYPWSTGVLSADTWTKIVKVIPGNSNLQIDNNSGEGFRLTFGIPGYGTNWTGSGRALETWATTSGDRSPDATSTWYTTNNATFEITGVQLEVGSVASPFEHRSYGDEFLRCARYYQEQQGGSDVFMYAAKAQGTTSADVGVGLVVPLRSSPTVVCSGHRLFHSDGVGYTSSSTTPTVVQWDANHSIHSHLIALNAGGHSGVSNNECCTWALSSAALTFDSEL